MQGISWKNHLSKKLQVVSQSLNNPLIIRKGYTILLNWVHLLLKVLYCQYLHSFSTSSMWYSLMFFSRSFEALVEVLWWGLSPLLKLKVTLEKDLESLRVGRSSFGDDNCSLKAFLSHLGFSWHPPNFQQNKSFYIWKNPRLPLWRVSQL